MKTKADRSLRGAHRDHVAQVYLGMVKRGDSGEILRQRIDWMVDQALGPRILDVGCSEGILEILLARKGFDVTGVDIDTEALAFARDLFGREPEEVRSRVRFVEGDLAYTRLLEEKFDTLVMGEVLEHLQDPQGLLDRSLDLVRPEGRVIITAPFGYHPDEDHRQTFCLSSLISLVKPRCALEHLRVEGGYIRMVGRVSSSTERSWQQLTGDQLLSMTEASMVSAQRRLYGNISRQKTRVSALEQQVQKRKDKASDLQESLIQERQGRAQLQKEFAEGLTKTTELQRKVEEGQTEAAVLQQEVEKGQARAAALQQEVEEGQASVAALQKEVEMGQAGAAALQREVEEGQAKSAALQLEAEESEAKAATLLREVEEARELEGKLRQSIRWQLGTLLVDAARRPSRIVRLPFDMARLSLVAFERRRSNSIGKDSSSKRPQASSSLKPQRTRVSAESASRVRPVAPTTPTRPHPRGPSGDQMTEWTIDQVEGHRVAVVGCDNAALFNMLDRLRFQVTAYEFGSSFEELALVTREEEIDVQRNASTGLNEECSSAEDKSTLNAPRSAETTILCGMPHAEAEAKAVLDCVQSRLSIAEGKVIVIQPRFNAFAQKDKDTNLTTLLTTLRTTTVPEYLSLANGNLRFVGRFSQPSPEAWPEFEAGLWPELTHEIWELLQSRQRKKIKALEQRVQDLLESTSYKAGRVLVSSAKQPRTLWKAPFRLWRLYQSTRPVVRARPSVLPSRNGQPVVSFPEFAVPAPASTGAPIVATIMDTFTEFCFRYEADLVFLSPTHWKQQLERTQPAMLLVESAWAGNNGAWRHLITGYSEQATNPLRGVLEYCGDHGIRRVFWNKEDPPNFDVFIDAAKEFDSIFTTDADCIPRYKELCGHDQVYLMPFACQPRLHNPIRENSWPRHPVCFAGSWMEKYPERKKSLQDLLGPALAFGLHIFDRNFNRPGYTSSNYRFPDRYQSAIKGSLDYKRMLTAYRCYDVMMNVNSVTDSPTMFSRRVFESLACGTPVISTDSTGLRAVLGDYVRITRGPEDTATHLSELLNDEERRMREGHQGYRHVHEHHTYGHRMNEVFLRIGLKPSLSIRDPSVSVIAVTCRPENVERVLANYMGQCYEKKELVLFLYGSVFDLTAVHTQVKDIDNVHIMHVHDSASLGECFNRGVEAASGDYIARMDDKGRYGERYLSDTMLAAGFSQADILGKGTYFVHVESRNVAALRRVRPAHTFTDMVVGETLTAPRDVWKRFPVPDSTGVGENIMLANARKEGCRIYSVDAFNFLQMRQEDTKAEARKLEDDEYLKDCVNLQSGLDLKRVMI